MKRDPKPRLPWWLPIAGAVVGWLAIGLLIEIVIGRTPAWFWPVTGVPLWMRR